MVNKNLLQYITKNAGREVAAYVEKSDEAERAKAALRQSEDKFEETITGLQKREREALTQGVESVAIAGAIGFGIGGAICYLAHDSIVTYFGKKSWAALLTLPGAGVIVLAATPSIFKIKKAAMQGSLHANSTERATGYGLGLGLLGVGGYMSYQDYVAP